jgi:hypothetical protein
MESDLEVNSPGLTPELNKSVSNLQLEDRRPVAIVLYGDYNASNINLAPLL